MEFEEIGRDLPQFARWAGSGIEPAHFAGFLLPTCQMLAVEPKQPPLFPDNPTKWEGWGNYKADDPYARLCLDPKTKPCDEQ
ncbi:MAG TPA: hypothetical protein VK993_03555, partial [Chthoniobacterales bacterium]|nr:hypothetical protein [Chthoniobacterales bacterium]